MFKANSLVAKTVAGRVEDNNSQLKRQGNWFWVVFLGSWWIDRCYQYCSVVTWKVNAEFEVTEELVIVNSVHETTADKNTYWKTEKIILDNLKWSLLTCYK